MDPGWGNYIGKGYAQDKIDSHQATAKSPDGCNIWSRPTLLSL